MIAAMADSNCVRSTTPGAVPERNAGLHGAGQRGARRLLRDDQRRVDLEEGREPQEYVANA